MSECNGIPENPLLQHSQSGLSTSTSERPSPILESLWARPNIICLQEHKLRAGQISRISSEVWSGAYWLCAPALTWTGSMLFKILEWWPTRVGSHLVLTVTWLNTLLDSEGMSICKRAVWICISHPKWGRLGLVGIYSPNDIFRCSCWIMAKAFQCAGLILSLGHDVRF